MCGFCEIYENVKETAEQRKSNLDIDTEIVITIVENKYKNGNFKGCLTHRGMKFYYCPICGRKLNEVSE